MGRFKTAKAWNALFSSLAFAEKAAANECLKVAERFRSDGLDDLAKEYEQLASEENRHHELALSVAREIVPITDRAKFIYDGGFFTENGPVIERLMSVHFVFEPSALAFLGYISSHARELIEDTEWADQITKAFNQILKDEVRHVTDGGELIKRFWANASFEERKTALKTMRKHRAFLKAGLISFFGEEAIEKYFLSKMLGRFDFYYERATGGVLNGNQAQVAS